MQEILQVTKYCFLCNHVRLCLFQNLSSIPQPSFQWTPKRQGIMTDSAHHNLLQGGQRVSLKNVTQVITAWCCRYTWFNRTQGPWNYFHKLNSKIPLTCPSRFYSYFTKKISSLPVSVPVLKMTSHLSPPWQFSASRIPDIGYVQSLSLVVSPEVYSNIAKLQERCPFSIQHRSSEVDHGKHEVIPAWCLNVRSRTRTMGSRHELTAASKQAKSSVIYHRYRGG